MGNNTCISCGDLIPEGKQVCYACSIGVIPMSRKKREAVPYWQDILAANEYCKRMGWESYYIEHIDGRGYAVHELKGATSVYDFLANEYQMLAQRTANYRPAQKKEVDPKLLNGVMGLNGEAGEVIDIVKKAYFQGHDLDREKLIDELGDVLWYVAETAEAAGVRMSEIMQKNIDKLKKRYPEGFSADKSVNREEYKQHE